MTHEYIIGLGGRIEPAGEQHEGATAIGWAADSILAVGSDRDVRAISRGDSTFLDLGGCHVTALPEDIEAAMLAARSVAPESVPRGDVGTRLAAAGVLPAGSILETGTRADLAFWGIAGELLAITRDGLFSQGDPKRGPFPEPSSTRHRRG